MEDVAKFFSEMGFLKRLRANGIMMTGVKDPDSIAEHSFRAALIGIVLADMEGANVERVATMCLIHDITEARIGDQNKVSARYYSVKDAEKIASKDQLAVLSQYLQESMARMQEETSGRIGKDGDCAKDADLLEQAITAKEYVEQGYKGAQDWINNVGKRIQTNSAKKILSYIDESNDFTNSWWQGLKNIPKS